MGKGPRKKKAGLYDQNNFYYCRFNVAHCLHLDVYTTKTISTIVDRENNIDHGCSLYDQNNFYYCRFVCDALGNIAVYTTKTISTIVDRIYVMPFLRRLYDQNNFYYCRSARHSPSVRVYTTKTISTIVDPDFRLAKMLSIRPKQFLLL